MIFQLRVKYDLLIYYNVWFYFHKVQIIVDEVQGLLLSAPSYDNRSLLI